MPTEDTYSGHLDLSHVGSCKRSNLETISPELVLFPDFWVLNVPRYFCFSLNVRRDSYSPWLLVRLQNGRDIACFCRCWYKTCHQHPCVYFQDFSDWDDFWSLVSLWNFINVFPFDCKTFAWSDKVWRLNLRKARPVEWLLSLQLTYLSRFELLCNRMFS